MDGFSATAGFSSTGAVSTVIVVVSGAGGLGVALFGGLSAASATGSAGGSSLFHVLSFFLAESFRAGKLPDFGSGGGLVLLSSDVFLIR